MEHPYTLMIVEDEEMIRTAVAAFFEAKGYRVLTAEDGETALKLFDEEQVDFILLDLMLPGVSGEEVCRRLRIRSQVPILMLTAKTQDSAVIEGFDLGADDYVTKPFSMKQLLARVEAIRRRTSPREDAPKDKDIYIYEDLRLDGTAHQAFLKGTLLELTPIEWRILYALAAHPCKTFTRDELLDLAFDSEYDGFDRSVDTHIKNLRKKLGDDPRDPRYLFTVRGVGYRLGGKA